EIDDIAFTNLANLPFGKLIGRNGAACGGHAPVANAGATQTVGDGVTVTLDGSASSSPDSKPLTYQWVQQSGPAATLANATSANAPFPSPRATGSKVATFALQVSDGSLVSSASTDVTINHVNHAPVANAGPDQSVDGNKTVTLDGSASSDPDG